MNQMKYIQAALDDLNNFPSQPNVSSARRNLEQALEEVGLQREQDRMEIAKVAMCGLLSNPNIMTMELFQHVSEFTRGGKTLAVVAEVRADALLEELDKTKGES